MTRDHIHHIASNDLFIDRLSEIKSTLSRNGYAVIKGLVDTAKLRSAIAYLKQIFDYKLDVRVSGHYKRGMKNFQRLDLGEYGASSRFCRYFFCFPWNHADDELTILNEQLLFLRNAISGTRFGTVDDDDPSRFAFSYFIQYPRGGGFMSKHFDRTQRTTGDNAFVVYVALTQRGQTFSSGGGYVIKNGQRIDVEADVEFGDIVIYDGDWEHGVAAIDLDGKVEFDTLSGRIMLTSVVNYFQS